MLPFDSPPAFSVTEMLRLARETMEGSFPRVKVQGELTNVKNYGSGHVYFAMKDGGGVLECALFKGDASKVRFKIEHGLKVEATGRLTIYPAQGKFQLVVHSLEAAGLGELQRRFEELKARLLEEGLFQESRKRALPRFPLRLGVVTSPTGAVIQDILRVARRRWPLIQIILAPVKVQGEGAAAQIVAAIERMGRFGAADVLIVGRGGGSLEDLWAFNEEAVVRAVAASRIPVISAVGHETDFTLCDFAADWRAPTPSAAAERAVPDRQDYALRVRGLGDRMRRGVESEVRGLRLRVAGLERSHALGRPRDVVREKMQFVDDLAQRLGRGASEGLLRVRERLSRERARLQALSPEQVLARGYAFVEKLPEDFPVTGMAQVAPGDSVRLTLHDGRARARIEGVEPREILS